MSGLIGNIPTWVINAKFDLRCLVFGVMSLAGGCGDSDLGIAEQTSPEERLIFQELFGGNSICASPVAVSGRPTDSSVGYIIEVSRGANVFSESVRLMDAYADLELFSASESCNCMHVNSSDDTLEFIRCEPNIVKVSYDFDQLYAFNTRGARLLHGLVL